MTFASPWLLWLLVLPVLLAAWEITGPRPRVALPLDHGQQRSGNRWAFLMAAAGLLPSLLLAVAILIASEPVRSAQPQQVRQLTNIEFVLDVSGSMESQFGEGSRYDAAMAAINEFTGRRQGDAFGLTIFGNEVLEWTPLTQDTSAISSATPFLRPELLPQQLSGTEIGKAVKFCNEKLSERGEGDRMLILISDGESADLDGSKARQIGVDLAEQQVVLYAIYIGDGAAPQDLRDLAEPSGGQVFAAADRSALATVFARIDHMQPIKLKPAAAQQVYNYFPLAVAGLSLLGVMLCSGFGLRYTPW